MAFTVTESIIDTFSRFQNTTLQIHMVGTGTSWTGGTVFTATGDAGTGVALSNVSVSDGTHATADLNVGTSAKLVTIHQGVDTYEIIVIPPIVYDASGKDGEGQGSSVTGYLDIPNTAVNFGGLTYTWTEFTSEGNGLIPGQTSIDLDYAVPDNYLKVLRANVTLGARTIQIASGNPIYLSWMSRRNPLVPTSSVVAELAGRVVLYRAAGDSLTGADGMGTPNSSPPAAVVAFMGTVTGETALAANGGKGGSSWADWLPSAPASGSSQSILDPTKNLFNALVDEVISGEDDATDKYLTIALGRNNMGGDNVGPTSGDKEVINDVIDAFHAALPDYRIGLISIPWMITGNWDRLILFNAYYDDLCDPLHADYKGDWIFRCALRNEDSPPGEDDKVLYFANNWPYLTSDGTHLPFTAQGAGASGKFDAQAITNDMLGITPPVPTIPTEAPELTIARNSTNWRVTSSAIPDGADTVVFFKNGTEVQDSETLTYNDPIAAGGAMPSYRARFRNAAGDGPYSNTVRPYSGGGTIGASSGLSLRL